MKIRIIAWLLILVCVAASLASCAAETGGHTKKDVWKNIANIPNSDGEIGSAGGKKDHGDVYYAAADCTGDVVDRSLAELGEILEDYEMSAYSAEGEAKGHSYDIFIGGESSQMVYRSGTLTAGEIRDNNSPTTFLGKFTDEKWSKIANDWKIPVSKSLKVNVKNGDEPVKGAQVTLLDADGGVIRSAVTDHNGAAYLYWADTVEGKSANDPVKKILPVTVKVEAAGKTESAVYDGKESVDVQINAQNGAVGLDLMLMVDTTGSMGDELEYLKAELRDMLTRVSEESGAASLRTSVNFYRDEGDEYVVRYFGFKDTIDEAVANISTQYAAGGGDTPEAVDVAFDNAVNAHAWSEDNVKIMFFVLDAPPHYNENTVGSIMTTLDRAAELGIRVIPVMASGSDGVCEVLFRSIAAISGGTYVFLTDDSGIGHSHSTPSDEQYGVEKLNELMIRLIKEYCS